MTTSAHPDCAGAQPDLSLDDALQLIRTTLQQRALPVVERPLGEALGCVLAETLLAPLNLPPFDNSAMDGYALAAAELPATGPYDLPLDGRTLAGDSADELLPGHARRITTGAPLPAGADTVIVQERVRLDDDVIRFEQLPPLGANIRRAGEDLSEGTEVLQQGTRLGPLQIGLLAALGQATVSVHRRPRVAILSTGDELIEPGAQRRGGQIYDSNRFLLLGLLARLGADVVMATNCGDQREALLKQLEVARGMADLVVTSGGVSVGDADLLPELVGQMGQVHFHRLNLKPGRPVLYADLSGTPLFGLPGNPVSVLVTSLKLVRPAIELLGGERVRGALQMAAQLEEALDKPHHRLEFLRGRMTQGASGKLWVRPVRGQGSHQLASLRDADCLIVVPEGPQSYAAGDTITVEPLLPMLS
ncbi:MAG: molybdopterin molybdotransferase MoeA [Xanthomonadales bacterium]|nr:molybdopterin molybdotransferase MoeA [Xanthomonadales bacterium]MCB1635166.1 molybdopterin molybdotransferase MoeA [Xanthomonadales bacterium]